MRDTEKILQGLNPEQRRAVEATEGPVLVLAGAGTGKTRVITVRIAHLCAKGVAPENVLAMTFTNKAAAEMAQRVGSLVGKRRGKALTVGTFHAFCVRAIREHAEMLGYPRRFSICDAADQLAALKGALRELRIPEATIQPRALQSAISLAKNRCHTADGFLESAADDRDELIGRAWKRYDEHLGRTAQLDFDDLLLQTLRLLTDFETAREKFRERFRYVLVDEYQDTNAVQFEILHRIAGEHTNLCAVGDDDQSIYGWRGADVRNILDFERHFPRALVVRLETNYRSTTQILSAANRLIRNNPSRHEKELRSALGDGPLVTAQAMRDESEEADHVVREIQELNRDAGTRFADFAILFRTQTQPRAFETQLRARNVPYVLVGGQSFFDRKEVRDVLAYLKVMANPDDEVSLLRVVNAPPRGMGKTSVEKILARATSLGVSATRVIERPDGVDKLPPAAVSAVQAMLASLRTIEADLSKTGLVEGMRRMLDVVGYRSEVERAYKEEAERESRWEAVMEVLNAAENFVRRRKRPTLGGFLEELALNDADDKSRDATRDKREADGVRDAVRLMTLHAAKGLEFPRVYLVGLEENILPHARAVAEDSVEEERRLAYVGVTRAQRNLSITLATERARYGRRVQTHGSRFLYEIKGQPPPPGWVAAGTAEAAPGKTKKKATRRRRNPRAAKRP